MTPSRVVPLGIAVALVVAACGADDPGGTADDGLRPPVPIQVTAGGGDVRLAAEAGDAAIEPGGSFMPWFGGFEFVADPGLPALPTNSTGFQFTTGGTVDVADVARLAEALSVPGDPVRGGGEGVDGKLWQVGPDDGTAPSLTIIADAQLGWYYSSAWSDAVDSESCRAVFDDEGDVVGDDCPEPVPPAGVPTAADAEADARSRLATMGFEPAEFEFESYADEWYASVTAWQVLAGVRSPVSWSFGYAGEGVLQWAGGYLAEPAAAGPYPLIGLDEALERLADQGSVWAGVVAETLVDDLARGAAPADAGVGAAPQTADETVPGETEVDETVPGETVPDETVPVETVPDETLPGETLPDETVPDETVPGETVPVETVPPSTVPVETLPGETVPVETEVVVATLVDVRADLWWAWDADGSIWLLPAYTFTDTEGRTHTVPAVTEEYLIVVEPEIVPVPLPAEPLDPVLVDPEPGVEEPMPIDEPLPIDDFEGLVGMTLEEATAKVEPIGAEIRVIRRDGEDLAATMDYRSNRLNVAVSGDVITDVISVG